MRKASRAGKRSALRTLERFRSLSVRGETTSADVAGGEQMFGLFGEIKGATR